MYQLDNEKKVNVKAEASRRITSKAHRMNTQYTSDYNGMASLCESLNVNSNHSNGCLLFRCDTLMRYFLLPHIREMALISL